MSFGGRPEANAADLLFELRLQNPHHLQCGHETREVLNCLLSLLGSIVVLQIVQQSDLSLLPVDQFNMLMRLPSVE